MIVSSCRLSGLKECTYFQTCPRNRGCSSRTMISKQMWTHTKPAVSWQQLKSHCLRLESLLYSAFSSCFFLCATLTRNVGFLPLSEGTGNPQTPRIPPCGSNEGATNHRVVRKPFQNGGRRCSQHGLRSAHPNTQNLFVFICHYSIYPPAMCTSTGTPSLTRLQKYLR